MTEIDPIALASVRRHPRHCVTDRPAGQAFALQHGEVARIVNCMTLHSEGLKAEVGVRELHDQLSRYLRHVSSGGDVVVTMRGRRVARLSGLDAGDPLADLRARGLVRDPQQTRRRTSGHSRLTVAGTVSDLVSEQRR